MGEIEKRLARIEAHLGFNKPDFQKKSPREQAEGISQGTPEHYVGKKSIEVLAQEAQSIFQNFEPENLASFSEKEKSEFLVTVEALFNDIKGTTSSELKKEFLSKLAQMRKVLKQ